MATALQQHLGTAITLDEEEAADPITPALTKLIRTGFVDDEDDVVLLTAKMNA